MPSQTDVTYIVTTSTDTVSLEHRSLWKSILVNSSPSSDCKLICLLEDPIIQGRLKECSTLITLG